jgi:hypothetical protein
VSVELNEVSETADASDSPLIAHYADRDEILKAFVYGEPIVALCGKRWVPYRNGDALPLCPMCEELHDILNNINWSELL